MPEITNIKTIEEPWIKATILVPDEYLGAVLKLCEERRGHQVDLTYAGTRAMVVYDFTSLNEVVFDFYDRLKSVSSGYASFDWQMEDYKAEKLVKMSVLVNEEPVDALSVIVHSIGHLTEVEQCKKLKDLIPRHQFKIPVQALLVVK